MTNLIFATFAKGGSGGLNTLDAISSLIRARSHMPATSGCAEDNFLGPTTFGPIVEHTQHLEDAIHTTLKSTQIPYEYSVIGVSFS